MGEIIRNESWRLRGLSVAIGVLAALAWGTLQANAEGVTTERPKPPANADEFTTAELEDLAVFAEQHGQSLDEVKEHFAGQSEFMEVVDGFRSQGGLVYAEWRGPEEGGGLIVLRPESRAKADRLGITADPDIEVRFSKLPTEPERERAVSKVAALLFAEPGTSGGVSADPLSGTIRATVLAPAPGSRSWSAEGAIAVPSPVSVAAARDRARESGFELEVQVDSRHAGAADARGGLGFGGCTGAFIVKSGSQWGISTASHCTTVPTTYDGSYTGTTSELSGRDVQWTRLTSGTKTAQFRVGSTTYRTATSSGNPVVGAAICRYGKTTGMHCDAVGDSGICWTYPGLPQYCGLYATDNKTGEPGDSGGPYFYGTKALGVHSGYRCYLFNCDDMFSGVGSLNLLNLTVNTA